MTTSSSELTSHVELSHEKGKKKYKCDDCPFTAAKKITLKQHLEAAHGIKRPYACELCDYATDKKDDLKKHGTVHQTVKPYQCEWCSYASGKNYLIL